MPRPNHSEEKKKVREFLAFFRTLPLQSMFRIVEQLELIRSDAVRESIKPSNYPNDPYEEITG